MTFRDEPKDWRVGMEFLIIVRHPQKTLEQVREAT
jgi:hypothetical protein